MIKYPSIEHFHHIVDKVKQRAQCVGRDDNDELVYDETTSLPILKFRGTVKLHGTNSSVVYRPDGTIQAQFRNREISVDNDNVGFAKFVHEEVGAKEWEKLFERFHFQYNVSQVDSITLYGEWCGRGINKGAAICGLKNRIFVLFGATSGEGDDIYWLDLRTWVIDGDLMGRHQCRIYNIFEFPHHYIDIDFNSPDVAQQKMEELTADIEKECPVAKHFGVSGLGEGMVWTCLSAGYDSPNFTFKVKGEEHRIAMAHPKETHVQSLMSKEKLELVQEFVEQAANENRLQQGIEYLKEMNKEISMKSTSDFIKWVLNDVIKEEYDVMEALRITQKELSKVMPQKTVPWFKGYLNKQSGLRAAAAAA